MGYMEGNEEGVGRDRGNTLVSLQFWARTITDHGAGARKPNSVLGCPGTQTLPSCPAPPRGYHPGADLAYVPPR